MTKVDNSKVLATFRVERDVWDSFKALAKANGSDASSEINRYILSRVRGIDSIDNIDDTREVIYTADNGDIDKDLQNRIDDFLDKCQSRIDKFLDKSQNCIDDICQQNLDDCIDNHLDARLNDCIDARIDNGIDRKLKSRIDEYLDANLYTLIDNRLDTVVTRDIGGLTDKLTGIEKELESLKRSKKNGDHRHDTSQQEDEELPLFPKASTVQTDIDAKTTPPENHPSQDELQPPLTDKNDESYMTASMEPVESISSDNGVTQSALAKLFGFNPDLFGKYVRGVRKPTTERDVESFTRAMSEYEKKDKLWYKKS